jgi:hypothetical protein
MVTLRQFLQVCSRHDKTTYKLKILFVAVLVNTLKNSFVKLL